MSQEQYLQQVAETVLEKLDAFLQTVEPENLSPQTMKHITATLKDIRELTQESPLSDGTCIRVEFPRDDWNL